MHTATAAATATHAHLEEASPSPARLVVHAHGLVAGQARGRDGALRMRHAHTGAGSVGPSTCTHSTVDACAQWPQRAGSALYQRRCKLRCGGTSRQTTMLAGRQNARHKAYWLEHTTHHEACSFLMAAQASFCLCAHALPWGLRASVLAAQHALPDRLYAADRDSLCTTIHTPMSAPHTLQLRHGSTSLCSHARFCANPSHCVPCARASSVH